MTHTYKVGDKGKTRGGDDYEVTAVGRKAMLVLIDGIPDEQIYMIDGKDDEASEFYLIPPKRRIQGCITLTPRQAGNRVTYTARFHDCESHAREDEPGAVYIKHIDIEEGEGL